MGNSEQNIFTIGHSTRTLEEFVELLHRHAIDAIADVRRFPYSRRFPRFNAENLAVEFPKFGLQYFALKSLGGRRRPDKGSINLGWRNVSFRGYADYMQTEDFARGLEDLLAQARLAPTAIMCAEAVPWRCHRSLIADALVVRGWNVLDILESALPRRHELTPFARVDGYKITYPEGQECLLNEEK